MEQYISKSAVVAQANIEITGCRLAAQQGILTEFGRGKLEGLEGIVDYLDTIEVKEIDLEKELNDFIEEQKAWIKDDRVVEYNNGDSFNHIYDLEPIARHFFELGLKAKEKRIV